MSVKEWVSLKEWMYILILINIFGFVTVFVGLHDLDNAFNLLQVKDGGFTHDVSISGKESTPQGLHSIGMRLLAIVATVLVVDVAVPSYILAYYL